MSTQVFEAGPSGSATRAEGRAEPCIPEPDRDECAALRQERWELLRQITQATDKMMTALAFVWLGLLILDFTRGLSRPMQWLSQGIWAVFVVDFAVKFLIAPHKREFLRRNVLTAIALVLPAFRILRVFRALRFLRAARAARSVGLLRTITSINRGMNALGRLLGGRGFGYVGALTILMTFAGAAGMFAFERPTALRQEGIEATGLPTYGDAVWWTAMVLTTIGPEYWPKTAEGRALCLLLALYAFAVFGYLTAAIASIFVHVDTARPAAAVPAPEASELAALRAELAALRRQLAEWPVREPGRA